MKSSNTPFYGIFGTWYLFQVRTEVVQHHEIYVNFVNFDNWYLIRMIDKRLKFWCTWSSERLY